MNTDIKAVHFTLKDGSRDYLTKKLLRIHNAEEMIVDLLITLTYDKEFFAEATVNFRWSKSIHVKEADFDLHAAIDKLIDKLDTAIVKEKEKEKRKR
ncbi:MAG: ribosome-associated translation inhibitor RaiA [Treponema sp.]|jgi:putative sigma-54 modulation protein|nr:ribosome-associated translation inhibitor RaiA [Treponema sp.]